MKYWSSIGRRAAGYRREEVLNQVILMGRLAAGPELRKTASSPSAAFRLAVDRNYTPRGQEKQADFISVVAWRQTAEFAARFFNKGQLMAVEGSIQTRQSGPATAALL